MIFERKQIETLRQRLGEAPQFLIVVAGPRQIGKSTMVRQALKGKSATFRATDQPITEVVDPFFEAAGSRATQAVPGAKPTTEWIVQEWTFARSKARSALSGAGHILAIDEIQKIPRWSEVVKGLWDQDRAEQLPLHIILLGSSPWLMQKGLSESLAGRYESIQMAHWSYGEMQKAFNFSLEEYVYFGGYPGSANLIRNEGRWREYVRDSLIRPNIENDILQMTRVDKPALLKNLFELGSGSYSGQIISFTKLLGQLQDAGNTVTLAHYLDLLSQAGLLTGIKKFAGQEHRQRASPPKMNVHNNALISALGKYKFDEAKNDRSYWGRLVESSVGSHLINNNPEGCELHYWRESPDEVDFVLTSGKKILAIEVKSSSTYTTPKGLQVFSDKFKNVRTLIIGDGEVPLQEFLSYPVDHWLE